MAQASAENLEHTRPAEKEREASVQQREQLASTPEPSLQKEKEQSRLSKAPDHEGEESQREREPHLARMRRIRVEAWRGKSGLYDERRQIPRRKGRSRRKHERVSGRKGCLGGSAESWFHSKSGQT